MPKIKRKSRPWAWIAGIVAILLSLSGPVLLLLQREEAPPPETEATETASVAATVPASPLSPGDFVDSDGFLSCDSVDTMLGIDVSKYQPEVDWQQVKSAGVDFVMVRLGYRGYSDGALNADPLAADHLQGARDAGLLVGAYFYSQAVTEEEAREEAAWALQILGDFTLDLPLSFDWEIGPRTETVDADTATACTLAFCAAVESAGLEAMIYFNSYQAAERLELTELTEYAWWLSMYSHDQEFPCRFDLWQYTDSGTVPGIAGAVDLNVMLTGGFPGVGAAEESK